MREEQKLPGIVLVADSSDGSLNSILNEALAPTEYPLFHVRNVGEAIATLELLKSEIELAIIEEHFPAVSGFNLVGRLVMRDQPRPVKIIMTTGRERPLSPQLVRELGGDAVVSKPTPPDEWHKIIVALLERESE